MKTNNLKTYYFRKKAEDIVVKCQADDPDWNYSIKPEKHRGMDLWIIIVRDDNNEFLGYL
jgi:hypothetical protein